MNKYKNMSKSILHLKHNIIRKKYEYNINTWINRFKRDIICSRKYYDEIKKNSDYEAFYLIKT